MNNYFYIDDATKQQFGPFPVNQLQAKGLQPSTMVWSTGMDDWVEAEKVAALSILFDTPNSTLAHNISDVPPAYNEAYTQPRDTFRHYMNENRMRPHSWMAPAILVTIFTCSPIALIGIIFAAQVDGKYNRGDYLGAISAAKTAKILTLVGLGITVLFILFFFFIGGLSYWSLFL